MASTTTVHPRLSFDEVNIVLMNIRGTATVPNVTLADFLYRLDNLLRHTPDSCLSGSIRSLREKINELTQAEFEQLCQDSANGTIMFPENYPLPAMPT